MNENDENYIDALKTQIDTVFGRLPESSDEQPKSSDEQPESSDEQPKSSDEQPESFRSKPESGEESADEQSEPVNEPPESADEQPETERQNKFRLFQNPVEGSLGRIIHALPSCPYCFHQTPYYIGFARIKERRPGADQRAYKVARLYRCPNCGQCFVTSEEIPVNAAPVPFHSPVGNWTRHKIEDKQRRLTDQLNRLQSGGDTIITRAIPAAGIYPQPDGRFRLAFNNKNDACDWINAIAKATDNYLRNYPIFNQSESEPAAPSEQ